jgi:hypothetical protein
MGDAHRSMVQRSGLPAVAVPLAIMVHILSLRQLLA